MAAAGVHFGKQAFRPAFHWCVQVVLSSEQPPPSQAPDDSDPETAPGLDHHVVGQMLQNVLPEVEPGDEKRDLLYSLLTTVQREEDREVYERVSCTPNINTPSVSFHPVTWRSVLDAEGAVSG